MWKGKYGFYPNVGDYIWEFDISVDWADKRTVCDVHEHIVHEDLGESKRKNPKWESKNRKYLLESVDTGEHKVRIVSPMNSRLSVINTGSKRVYKYWSDKNDLDSILSRVKENLDKEIEDAEVAVAVSRARLNEYTAFSDAFTNGTLVKRTKIELIEDIERR